MKGQVLDILVGAATIAIGYTLAAVIYKSMNSSATRSTTDVMAPAPDAMNGMAMTTSANV
jgi:hypothetical protein